MDRGADIPDLPEPFKEILDSSHEVIRADMKTRGCGTDHMKSSPTRVPLRHARGCGMNTSSRLQRSAVRLVRHVQQRMRLYRSVNVYVLPDSVSLCSSM